MRLDARQAGARAICSGRPARRALVVVLRPAVERPVEQHDAPGFVDTPVGAESRSQTRSVGTTCRRTRSMRTACACSAIAAAFSHVFGVAEDLDRLVRREHARDLGVHPRDGPELARPVGLVVRPADPGRPVRLPLGGHPHGRCARSRAEIPVQDRAVGVDAAVAQERPVAPHGFDERRVAAGDEDRSRPRRPPRRAGRTDRR